MQSFHLGGLLVITGELLFRIMLLVMLGSLLAKLGCPVLEVAGSCDKFQNHDRGAGKLIKEWSSHLLES